MTHRQSGARFEFRSRAYGKLAINDCGASACGEAWEMRKLYMVEARPHREPGEAALARITD